MALHYGIYSGTVVSNADPAGLGRVQVRVPQVYGPTDSAYSTVIDSMLPWALHIGLPSGGSHATGGTSWPANAGDMVAVMFMDGLPEKPVWMFANQTSGQAGNWLGNRYANGIPTDNKYTAAFGHILDWSSRGVNMTTGAGSALKLYDVTPNKSNIPPVTDGTMSGQITSFGLVPNGAGGGQIDSDTARQLAKGTPGFSASTGAYDPNRANPSQPPAYPLESASTAVAAPALADLQNLGLVQQARSGNLWVQVTTTNGTSGVYPVADISAEPGKLDLTYGAFTELYGNQAKQAGPNTSMQGTWKYITAAQAQSLRGNDTTTTAHAVAAVNPTSGAAPPLTPLTYMPQGGVLSPSQVPATGASMASLQAAQGGGGIFLVGDGTATHFAPTGHTITSPEHAVLGTNYMLTMNSGTAPGPGAGNVPLTPGGVNSTNYGTPTTVLSGGITADSTQLGTYSVSAAYWAKLWSQNTLELIGATKLGMAAGALDIKVVSTATLNVGAQLLMQGGTGTTGGAATATGAFIPVWQAWATATTYNFQTSWIVTGAALNASFQMQQFLMNTSQTISMACAGHSIVISPTGITFT